MDEVLAQKLSTYKAKQETADLISRTKVLLLVGPTGAGKDSLKDKLLETGNYHHIISHTTRLPRINHGVLEQNGREYYFIDKKTAEHMLDTQAFIEAKGYSGNLYGTSVAEIQLAHDEAKIATTDIEVQGVAEYKTFDPKVMAVFLLPPNFKIWQDRLMRRYGDVVDAADYLQRIKTGLQEMEQLLNTDYYMAVINDDLDKTYYEVQKITKTGHHEKEAEIKARKIAAQFAQDIQKYLDETA